MSKVRLLSLGLALMLLINLVLIFLMTTGRPGGPRHGRPDGGGEEPKSIIIERLHFDEDQIRKYEKLISRHRSDVTALEDQIRNAKNALYATLSDEHHSGKDSLESRLGFLQRNMEAIHYNHFADIGAICRPDQLRDFNALSGELAGFFDRGKKMPPPPKD